MENTESIEKGWDNALKTAIANALNLGNLKIKGFVLHFHPDQPAYADVNMYLTVEQTNNIANVFRQYEFKPRTEAHAWLEMNALEEHDE